MTRSILFIVQKNVINGECYFGSSNDLLLIARSLKAGLEVYVTTPSEIIKNQQNFRSFPALKLSNLNQELIDNQIKYAWRNQVINAILAQRFSDLGKSGILFEDAKLQNINLYQTTIFNRAEPISLTDEFYKILISLRQLGVKILPDPYLNYNLGDKLAVHLIHYNLAIKDINFDLGKPCKISFESKFIKISNEDFSADKIKEFYDFVVAKNFKSAKENFPKEYEIFVKGIEEYLKFHQELENDSIIKPARYFGGTGVVVAQNQILTFEKAIENICQSFFAILKDCKKVNHQELAFLPEIIVQERAKLADLGDLRIVISNNNLQGIFIRVNPDFEKTKANNLHFGGHPESLFKSYSISKEGIDLMIQDMKNNHKEIKKAKALYDLLDKIEIIKQIKIFKSYPIIGVDALLTEDASGNYKYGINEMNLTSPMGQVQLIILQIALKLNKKATEVLEKKGISLELEKYQILADFFKNSKDELALKAKEILRQNEELQDLIEKEIDELLKHNIVDQTLNSSFVNQ